ncbi:MAG: sulfatase-like hydrolase/transferase [Candidatus Brocadiia bacterium]
MKAIMLMFDTLNRAFLPPYGCDWVHAPNFRRLAERTVRFSNCYVGSAPCMPARRELHTGRYNFLHRSWGPMEPFDDSMPELLRANGVHTHLASDHMHYWEDGGATYHTRYRTWEISRGNQGDPWKGDLDPSIRPSDRSGTRQQEPVNRHHMESEDDWPVAKTFAAGLEFIEANHDQDDWFLHVETFDPHEPFFSHENYQALYDYDFGKFDFDWPPYREVREEPELVRHCRYLYAALLSMCDAQLGRVLDLMDRHGLWDDTLLIVNTDHGFMLGEHGFWAKMHQPFYDEIAHVPLFIWDPRSGRQGAECDALVQMIDMPATILEFFGIDRPPDMQGVPLRGALADDEPVREACLFGIHGAHVNCTDGRYVYMRAPANADNAPLYNYTLMPTHMRGFFGPGELREAELAPPFSFTKDMPVLKCPSGGRRNAHEQGTLLFDMETDPGQESPIGDADVEQRMVEHMVRLMEENEAPPEQFERLDLPR